MPAEFRSASNGTYAVRTNTTVTAPAGIVNGDKLIFCLFIGAAGTAPTPTAPTGFVAPSTGTWPINVTDASSFNVKFYVWFKDASGESGNYTATHSSGSSQGFMFVVQGGASGSPAATTNSGTGATATALGLTTSAPDALVAFLGFDWGSGSANLTPPTGTTPTFTERLDVAPLIYLATGSWSSSGATGNKSHTINNTTNEPWGAVLLAVEAASGGVSYTLAANAGSYSVSGSAAGLRAARVLSALSGSYAVSGVTASLRRGYLLAAAAGSYSVSGVDAALRATRVLLASPGLYSVSGSTATLRRGLRLAADAGSYALSGVDAALRRGYALIAASGSYALSGVSAALKATRVMKADSGSYAVSGSAADLTWSGQIIEIVSGLMPIFRPRRR